MSCGPGFLTLDNLILTDKIKPQYNVDINKYTLVSALLPLRTFRRFSVLFYFNLFIMSNVEILSEMLSEQNRNVYM